jgi:hypothetical protein
MLIEVFHPRDHKFAEIKYGCVIKRIQFTEMERYLLWVDCQVMFPEL